MCPYRRAKREDATSNPRKEPMNVHLGSVNDSFESLQVKCNDKANDLLKSVELSDGEEFVVAFWTEDFPELIGIATYQKTPKGMVCYTIDYSQSTL